MYSYNFFIAIRITYEELCINFSSILIGPKKFYRHFKKKFSEKLKISVLKKTQNILKIKSCKENANLNNCIYDLYFLNNNKYLKSFEDKSLSLRDFLLEEIPMENLVFYKHKTFYDFSTSKLLANFCVFDRFQQLIRNLFLNYNHIKNRFGRKLVLRKNSRFFRHFFFVFLDFFENCWKIFTFYLYNAPRIFTFPSETTQSLKLNYAIHRHKKKTYFIVKSIHSSLRSESKKLKT
ncbi:hypothetical protein AGLY_006591 [Aphis glycines]|uniref:Uncharacterized protein n=1 Tax=Aphis glycines TaxID=307491 RepID=A0A6G0TST1_APHGL|nr:hypothetical protein AGLY_006591 [Aphis glycines]